MRLIMVLLVMTFHFSVDAQNKKTKDDNSHTDKRRIKIEKTPKGFSKFPFSSFYIPFDDNDSFFFDHSHTGNYLHGRSTPKDFFVRVPVKDMLVAIKAYVISNTEVTNAQYREFVNWVIDSIGLTVMARIDPSYYQNSTIKSLKWSRRNEVLLAFNDRNSRFVKALDSALAYPVEENLIGLKEINADKLFYTTSTAKETIAIYPDTLVWLRDIPETYNEPISKDYFSRPYYDNYPVVGVNWYQAKAYCDWLSRTSVYEFRLPFFIEYNLVYSATKYKRSNSLRTNSMFFPWRHNGVVDNSGKYLANFGELTDSQGFKFKSYEENVQKAGVKDDVYTTKVASFPPAGYNIYDITGNVAEWVEGDFAQEYSFYMNEKNHKPLDTLRIQINENLVEIEKKFNDHFKLYRPQESMSEFELKKSNELMAKYSQKIASDFRHLSGLKVPKATMGGSFMDSPQFMRNGIIKTYSAEETHSFIGFRVAADAVMRWE